MNTILEMIASGCGRLADQEYRVGYIILDEDDDEPVSNIYEDPRICYACGSNWFLRDTGVEAKPELPRNRYVVGDWKEDGANRWPETWV